MTRCALQYWGTEPSGLREVSRALSLADEARKMLQSRLDRALISETEKLAARGGLGPAPPGAIGAPQVLDLTRPLHMRSAA